MFGFGKSAKLDERERLLQEREQALKEALQNPISERWGKQICLN